VIRKFIGNCNVRSVHTNISEEAPSMLIDPLSAFDIVTAQM